MSVKHRITVESRTWGNVPPHPSTTLHRAKCSCGWRGHWFHYVGNVDSKCGATA